MSKTILRSRCDACYNSPAAQWLKNNPEKARRASEKFRSTGKARAARIKKRFKISIDQFDDLLRRQGGACAICLTFVPGGTAKNFHIDHDHKTGAIRGLLCTNCNRGLGYFADDASRLRAAINYLS